MQGDSEAFILEQVQCALKNKKKLCITGAGSKDFYGRIQIGDELKINNHSGVVCYEPSELVITARAGTTIMQLQALLAENKQMIGFDPPFCSDYSTLGGAVASGLAGPGRPFFGGVRDFILGVKMINGQAEILRFGGQVMKNVAGFDHSRLMAGSLGTLGVLLEISLRVIPMPETVVTLSIDQPDSNLAIKFINELAAKPYPLSATAWLDNQLKIRCSGTESAVTSAVQNIGGEIDQQGVQFWSDLRDHQLMQFKSSDVVYRISVPPATPVFSDVDTQILDWNGAQRWLFDIDNTDQILEQLDSVGGHLTIFRGGNREDEVFTLPDPVTRRLHLNLKQAFDPQMILNSERMYKGL